MIKSKKQMFVVVGAFLVVMLLGTVTYAFFNYTRTGSANTIRVGRIAFRTNQTDTISLTNLFPIDPEETGIMEDATKVGALEIEIEGDTDYSGGIEYLVSSVDSSITTGAGKTVPLSLAVTVDGLGTSNANYFTARENTNASIYKKLVGDTLVGDQMLLVGFIKPNTTSGTAEGIDGSITIKAYLDKNKILISDTYDGTESDNMGTTNSLAQGKTVLTTTEWNALQSSGLSFKVKVEANQGIWVNGSLEEIMRKSAVMDNVNSTYVDNTTPGINFGAVSGDTNGKGVYMRAGTENDDYPIMYYRGAVEDNNVMFANKCWKAVRTTDTGGVKLIYNGELSQLFNKEYASPNTYATEHEGDIWTFDTSDSTWNYEVNDGQDHEFSFRVPAGENYDMAITGTTGSSCGLSFNVWKNRSIIGGNGGGGGTAINVTYSYGTLAATDELKLSIYGASSTSSTCSVNLKVNMQQGTTKLSKNDYSMLVETDSGEYGCDNSGANTQIMLNISGTDTNTFKFSTASGANNSPAYNGYMYGTVYESKQKNSSSTFKFGTGFTYNNGTYTLTSTEDGIATTRHYTCFTSSEICDGTDLGKIYYVYYKGGNYYYYIELENGKSVEDALREMQTNTTNSNAKEKIETWYASNMTNFTNKIEDTIYCNDRSMDTQTNGWVANGGSITGHLYYAPYGRASTSYSPSLSCTNINDAFTWKNGNGNQKLAYPVGMITSDEVMLAGGNARYPSTCYLTTGKEYWSLSPHYFKISTAEGFAVIDGGTLYIDFVNYSEGLRPVVSLKPGKPVVSGTGTVADPYVIE